jgi:hypothetical protein
LLIFIAPECPACQASGGLALPYLWPHCALAHDARHEQP